MRNPQSLVFTVVTTKDMLIIEKLVRKIDNCLSYQLLYKKKTVAEREYHRVF